MLSIIKQPNFTSYILLGLVVCLNVVYRLQISSIKTQYQFQIQRFINQQNQLQKIANATSNLCIQQQQKYLQAQKQYQQKIEQINKRLRKLQNIRAITVLPQRLQQLQSLSYSQRLFRLQKMYQQQQILTNFLLESVKQEVRLRKIQNMDKMAVTSYFKSQQLKDNWALLKYNIKSPYITKSQYIRAQQIYYRQQIRLQQKYQINYYPKQIPFCIVVPSFNNAKNFRYQFNLQSILNQNYKNYRVIIIDDGSFDKTGHLINFFKKKNNISEDKVKVIINKKQLTAVPNIHFAMTTFCKKGQVAFLVDGDDELVGKNVFKIFNALYQSKNSAIIYSQAFQWWVQEGFVKDNWSQQYTQYQKVNNLYRDVPQKISHLRSFRVDLYLQIKQLDLKDPLGQWFKSTYDQVICLPMLQLSCGNILAFKQKLYLYVYGTGYNDRMVDGKLQYDVAQFIKKKKPKYKCNQKFKKPQHLI